MKFWNFTRNSICNLYFLVKIKEINKREFFEKEDKKDVKGSKFSFLCSERKAKPQRLSIELE